MAAAGGDEPLIGESDKAVIALLQHVNELYGEHQQAAKLMRKGFLNMAKARQSMGRGALSALDCREKMAAQMTVEKYVCLPVCEKFCPALIVELDQLTTLFLFPARRGDDAEPPTTEALETSTL